MDGSPSSPRMNTPPLQMGPVQAGVGVEQRHALSDTPQRPGGSSSECHKREPGFQAGVHDAQGGAWRADAVRLWDLHRIPSSGGAFISVGLSFI